MGTIDLIRQHVTRAALPLVERTSQPEILIYEDHQRQYRIEVTEAAQGTLGPRWTITVSAGGIQEADSQSRLERLPQLSTSQHQLNPRSYRRWAPFSRAISNSEPRRAPEWVAAALATITERLALPLGEPLVEGSDLPAPNTLESTPPRSQVAPTTESNLDYLLADIGVALATQPEALRIVTMLLAEKGLVSGELAEQMFQSASLEVGDIDAVIAAANQGSELTPENARSVVLAALGGDKNVGAGSLAAAWDVSEAVFATDQECIAICGAIRNARDPNQSLRAYEALTAVASSVVVLHGGRQLLKRQQVTAAFKMQVLSAAIKGPEGAAAQLVKEALDSDLVTVFDYRQTNSLQAFLKTAPVLLQQVSQAAGRSGTVPDLVAALSLFLDSENKAHSVQYIRKAIERLVGRPNASIGSSEIVKLLEAGATCLLEQHDSAAITLEARQDAALLRRAMQLHPQLKAFEHSLEVLEAAASAASPAALSAIKQAADRERAIKIFTEQLAGGRTIVVVGGPRGELAKRIIEEFALRIEQVVWRGVTKDRKRSADWITEPIKGSSCAGVVVITGEVGHRESGLAKDQAARSGRPLSECERGTRVGLDTALIDLSLKISVATRESAPQPPSS